jgi:hypothetical protein
MKGKKLLDRDEDKSEVASMNVFWHVLNLGVSPAVSELQFPPFQTQSTLTSGVGLL